MQRLRDEVAVISGGAGGIGAATARLFVAEGARAALFLASEESSLVTGATVPVDGGMSV